MTSLARKLIAVHDDDVREQSDRHDRVDVASTSFSARTLQSDLLREKGRSPSASSEFHRESEHARFPSIPQA